MLKITRIWQHTGEPNRLHYWLEATNGEGRHLVEDRGSVLFDWLETERERKRPAA